MAKSQKKSSKLVPYKSYPFIGHDPIIDRVLDIVTNSGSTLQHIHVESGVSKSTIYNWAKGKTRRPSFSCVNAVGRACGKELIFRNITRN